MTNSCVTRSLAALVLLTRSLVGCGSSDTPPAGPKGATPDAGGCVKDTCAAASANCGKIEDNCNGILDCGTCKTGETCGAAGPNICGVGSCSKTTCAIEGKDCGQIADGCGDLLDCGTCTVPKTCGGGSRPDANVCG